MKVLHVIDRMDPKMGGVSQAVLNIISGLEMNQISNEIVSLDDPKSVFLTELGVKIHALGPANNPWCYSPKVIPWLLENIENYDRVIIHGLWQFHGYAVYKSLSILQGRAKRISKIINIKVYLMPHGMLDPYFQNTPERRIKAIRNRIYWKFVEKRIVNNIEGLLFTCEEEKNLARTTFKEYLPKQEYVVGLGVKEPPPFKNKMLDAFKGKCLGLGDEPYLLFLSRIHGKKGLDILLESYKKVLENAEKLLEVKKIPKLIIAGPGLETVYGKNIISFVKEDPFLSRDVYFTGMLTGDAKWGAFYGAEAFILPSHQENFGIAVVEALACKKPVLISKQVNIWREIHKMGGGMVEKDTIEGTMNLLNNWLNFDKSSKENFENNAGDTFITYFSIIKASQNMTNALV